MTNEETLELLKPIMLDGSEKVGDKVYCTLYGDSFIVSIDKEDHWSISTVFAKYSTLGYVNTYCFIPTLFKCNPFEWLNDQLFIEQRQNEMLVAELKERDNNQDRVIEVKDANGEWRKRVLLMVKNGYAICWGADNIEDAKQAYGTTVWCEWREVPTQKTITKEQALQMLAENGVDTTNLIIE